MQIPFRLRPSHFNSHDDALQAGECRDYRIDRAEENRVRVKSFALELRRLCQSDREAAGVDSFQRRTWRGRIRDSLLDRFRDRARGRSDVGVGVGPHRGREQAGEGTVEV